MVYRNDRGGEEERGGLEHPGVDPRGASAETERVRTNMLGRQGTGYPVIQEVIQPKPAAGAQLAAN